MFGFMAAACLLAGAGLVVWSAVAATFLAFALLLANAPAG